MARPRKAQQPDAPKPEAPKAESSIDILKTLVEELRKNPVSQGFVKKTAFEKKSRTPWNPTGGPRPRLKRKIYHHGMLIGDPSEPTNRLTNEEIELFNQLKPGSYCKGYVTVRRLRNKGIDIDYPIRTNAHKIRLMSEFGITSFAQLLQRCIDEAAKPKPVVNEDDE